MKEFNDFFSKVEHNSGLLTGSRTGENYTKDEIRKKYNDFMKYIKNSRDYYIELRRNKIDQNIFRGFYENFKEAFNRWTEYLETKGTLSFYVGRIIDALHIGLWDFDYVNDPDGQLSPFGPYLFQLLEVHRHRRIGILHALEQQQYHPAHENLTSGQLLSKEILKPFIEENDLSAYYPVVQFSAGAPAVFFTTPLTPSIITLDKSKLDLENPSSCYYEVFSALPHECGHAIAETSNGKKLLEEIKIKVKVDFKKSTDRYDNYWKWWIEECFADAIAVAVMKEAEIVSLMLLFKDLDLDKIPKHCRFLRVDNHPNRFIRIKVAIQVAKKLGLDETKVTYYTNKLNDLVEKKNNNIPLKKIQDKFHNRQVSLEQFESEISIVANALVTTPYNKENKLGLCNIKNLYKNFVNDLKNGNSNVKKAHSFLKLLINDILDKE